MAKDKRYTTVKNLISAGYIKSFRDIFDTVPKSVVYKDLGMNSIRFNKLMENVALFTLKDLFRIAALIDIEEKTLLELAYTQHSQTKKPKKKG